MMKQTFVLMVINAKMGLINHLIIFAIVHASQTKITLLAQKMTLMNLSVPKSVIKMNLIMEVIISVNLVVKMNQR